MPPLASFQIVRDQIARVLSEGNAAMAMRSALRFPERANNTGLSNQH
jgi:hypothetical protein